MDFASLPHRFGDRDQIGALRTAEELLEPEQSGERAWRISGRVLGRRGQGGVTFIDLEDVTGRVQLLAELERMGEEAYEVVRSVSIGDLVGVQGTAFRTRRGELSLQVAEWTFLAPCRLPFPDRHHGLQDVEVRHRQRYLDLMTDAEARERFIARARMIASIRRSLDEADFVEVETPVLQPLYGGAAARPFITHHNTLDRDLYLRVATELYLKRLVVGGLEKVYELGKDFRNEGVSHKHNPEFTMLEFYEAYADCEDVMGRTEQLVVAAAQAVCGTTKVTIKGQEIELAGPWPRITLGAAIEEKTGINPMTLGRDPKPLEDYLKSQGIDTSRDKTWAQLVDHLLSHYVEPTLISPTFIIDYPVELSPLSRRKPGEDGVVERFEAFCGGMEISNGFSELNDPDDQRARFEEQAEMGRAGDDEAHPVDEDYVTALEYGLPPTGGVGLGIDRLAMLLTGQETIREVVLFPAMRT
ncbi:MAG: lysine--tRNA ligase [Actinobacteria bacterium]|nr:lysine--tRNA ligase [Actinomycetota bacterium]